MDLLRITREIPSKEPDILFQVFGFPVSSSLFSILLITILFAILGYFATKRFKDRPSFFQSVVEVLYEAIEDLIGQITQSKVITSKIFPIIATLFIYIGASNLLGLVPGLNNITYGGKYVFITPTADFNTTFGLALAMVILLQFVSIKDFGIFGHLGKYFQFAQVYRGFRTSLVEGGLAIVNFMIGLLDIFSEIAKVISLSLRLFGNMYAGGILATLILGGFAYILPAAWLAMNLLSAVVQAMVFGSLVAAYYTLSIKSEEEAS